jgi:hypothetical protein
MRERVKPKFPQIRIKVFENDDHPVFIENRVISAMRQNGVSEVDINRMTYHTSNDMEATLEVIQMFVRLEFVKGKIDHWKSHENRVRRSF